MSARPLRRRARGAPGVEEARRRVGRLREVQHRRRARALGEDRGRRASARRGRQARAEDSAARSAARQGERRARLCVAAGVAARRGEAVARARAARRPVLEQGVARRRLVGRGNQELSRRARAVARAERSQLARLGRAGIAARGSICVCAARRATSRRRIATSRPSTRSPPRSTGSRTSIDAIEHGDLITRAPRRASRRGRRRVGMVLAPRQGAGHDREPLSLRAHGEQQISGGAQELSRSPVPQPQSRALAAEPRRLRRHPRYASARVRAAPAGDRREPRRASISTR